MPILAIFASTFAFSPSVSQPRRWVKSHAEARNSVRLFRIEHGWRGRLGCCGGAGRRMAAVVSRGGRPDLAGQALPLVQASTLLIVGEHDEEVLRLNEEAYAQLRCEKKLEVVPHATHLFEEPGALEEVARLAARWFANILGRAL